MKKRFIVASLIVVALTPFGWAASNLNLSKSNINRYSAVYPTELVTAAKIQNMLAAINQLDPADDAKLKQWLTVNFKQYGIDGSRVKKVVILPPSAKVKERTVILLTDPTDEARAIALAVKPSNSSNSNRAD